MSNFSNFFSSDFYSDGHAFHKSPRKKRSIAKSPATTKKKSTKESKKSTKESSKKNAMGRSRSVSSSSKNSAPVYQNYIFKKIQKSKEPSKKYEAIFQHYAKKDKLKVVAFGSTKESDYTQNKDKKYRDFYLKQNKIDTNNLMSPKTLEQMILWNKPTVDQSVKIYKKKWESKSKEL